MIRNLIKEPDNKTYKPKKKGKDGKESGVVEEEAPAQPRPIVKSFTDLQRLKVEKLMKNPDKPIVIPEPRKEKDYMVPSFVRNVMGSSAGAGSGEFHVYRHLRRKEYARQKTIQAKSVSQQLDDQYQNKLEENLRASEEKTAKKRAKRLKRKQRVKRPRQEKNDETQKANAEAETSEDDDNEEEDAENETKQETPTPTIGPAEYSEENSNRELDAQEDKTAEYDAEVTNTDGDGPDTKSLDTAINEEK